MDFEPCPTGVAVLGYLWSRYPGAFIGVFAIIVVVPVFITLMMLTIDDACQSLRQRWDRRREMRLIALNHGYAHGSTPRRSRSSRRPWRPEDEERWRNQLCMPPSYAESVHHGQRHPVEEGPRVVTDREESAESNIDDPSSPSAIAERHSAHESTMEEAGVTGVSSRGNARVDNDHCEANQLGHRAEGLSIRRVEAVAEGLNELGIESELVSGDVNILNPETDMHANYGECMASIATSIEPLHVSYESGYEADYSEDNDIDRVSPIPMSTIGCEDAINQRKRLTRKGILPWTPQRFAPYEGTTSAEWEEWRSGVEDQIRRNPQLYGPHPDGCYAAKRDIRRCFDDDLGVAMHIDGNNDEGPGDYLDAVKNYLYPLESQV